MPEMRKQGCSVSSERYQYRMPPLWNPHFSEQRPKENFLGVKKMSTAMKQLTPHAHAKVEIITPSLAEEYLKQNASNRPIRANHVRRLAAEMPTWKMNGDAIRFSANGRLIDGQHRLAACVESGIAFSSFVVRGLEESVFDTIDQCKVRTAGDIIHIAGEKNSSDMARALTLLWRLENGALGEASYPNSRERIEVLSRHPNLRISIDYGVALDVNRIIPRALVAFLHYIGGTIDPVKTKEFLEKLATGANLSPNSPILKFREAAIEMNSARKRPPHKADVLVALAFKAMQSHYDGREITRYLHYKRTEKFPSLHAATN